VDGVERVPLRIQLEELDAPVSGKAGQTVIYLLGSVKDLSKQRRHEGKRMDLNARNFAWDRRRMAAREDPLRRCLA